MAVTTPLRCASNGAVRHAGCSSIDNHVSHNVKYTCRHTLWGIQRERGAQYSIMAIPTMIVFKDGKELKRVSGVLPERNIRAMIEEALA